MSSPYLLKGFHKKGPGGTSQLVKFGSDAIVLENGATLTSHINDMSAHLPFSDIENVIIQRIHTVIGRVLDGGDGSTLLNKHATMKLLSDDIIAVTDTVNGFLNDLADGGVIDRLSDIVDKLSTHDTDISSIREDISILPSLVSQLNSATANIVTHTNELDLLSTNVDTLLPLLESYVTMSDTLVEIQTSINNINDTIVVVPTLSATVSSHTATLTELNGTLNSTIASVDTLLPLIDSYNTLLSMVTGHTTDITTLQTNLNTVSENLTSLTGKVDTNTSDIHILESSLINQATEIDVLESNLSTVSATVLGHTDDIIDIRQSVTSVTTAVTANASDIDIVESTLIGQATALSEVESNLATLADTVGDHTSELASISSLTTTLSSDLTTAISDISALEASQAAQDLSIQNIGNSISTIDAEIETLESNTNSNTSTILGLTSAVQATQNTVATQGETIETLTTEVTTVAETVDGLVNNISPRIIGIAHFPGTNSQNNFRHINEHGNFLVGFKYYTSPIYSEKMRDVVIGEDQMKEIDTLYIKTAQSGPVGTDSEGKNCWWISPDPAPGFRPMLAFKRDGVIKPHVYLGKYMGYYSIPETQPTTGYSRSTYESSIATYKNSGESTGFRMMDIYDLGLLRTLLLVFGGSTDVRTVWGDNVNNEIRPENGATGAKAFGIYDLWRSYHYCIDKIKVNTSRKIELKDPNTGSTIYTNLDMPYSTANRYISKIVLGDLLIGEEIHDYMELFLPAEYVTDIRDAAFMDGVRFTSSSTYSDKDIYIGGSPRDNSTDYISPGGVTDKTKLFCGIFMCVMEHNVNQDSSYGSMRLAKS